MSGFWRGYATVNDDIRHTYEQVFYGRQTTGNLNQDDMPGLKPEAVNVEVSVSHDAKPDTAPAASVPEDKTPDAAMGATSPPSSGPDQPREMREATAAAYTHAANAPGIRAEIEAVEGQPYRHTDAPDIEAPTVEAPPIEAPAIEPPVQPSANHAAFYGSIWGNRSSAPEAGTGIEAPPIEAPPIEAPEIGPAESRGDDLTPGY